MGYDGQELKDLYPVFGTEIPTTIGYRWQPCANGPESWDLIIKISAVAALVGKGFLEELTKDLYKWCKERLVGMVSKRDNNSGYVAFEFDDIVISIDSSSPNEDILDFFTSIPACYHTCDQRISSNWVLEPDSSGKLCLMPDPYSVGERIKERGGSADEDSISKTILEWQKTRESQQASSSNGG